ncbi:MAG TPA: ribose-phosphate diphosphokinase, partial [Patescibacteria group bacterium]
MKIFSGSSNKPLAQKIAEVLYLEVSPMEIFVFPDGERRIQIQEKVVNEDCIIVQSTAMPADQNYMELFFIIDGLKRSGAKSVTVVMPYLGYQRQDHIFRDGEAVSLDVVVHALESTGADKVIVFDLHSIKIPEVFNIPVTQLSALPIFADKIREWGNGIL